MRYEDMRRLKVRRRACLLCIGERVLGALATRDYVEHVAEHWDIDFFHQLLQAVQRDVHVLRRRLGQHLQARVEQLLAQIGHVVRLGHIHIQLYGCRSKGFKVEGHLFLKHVSDASCAHVSNANKAQAKAKRRPCEAKRSPSEGQAQAMRRPCSRQAQAKRRGRESPVANT